MYQINEKNLKYAYSKLKKYAYYFNSSNYLKDKIIAFEEKLKLILKFLTITQKN